MAAKSPSSVVIVGGGLIGLCSALFLNDRGVEVTVVDSGPLGGGAARGNAGLICTALLEPLPAPGAMRTAIKSLLNPAGALRLRWRELPTLTPWLLKFMQSANIADYHKGRLSLGALNSDSPNLWSELKRWDVSVETGPSLLVAMHDPAEAEKFRHELELMRDYSAIVPPTVLTGAQVREKVPALTQHIDAGFFLDNDLPVDPREVVDSLVEVLRRRGVRLIASRPIKSVDHKAGTVNGIALTDGTRLKADDYLLAAGSGSHAVGKLFGVDIKVIAGQGYNFVLPSSPDFTHPVIFQDAHFVATPLADGVRLGGTMELTGDNPVYDQRRVDAIIRSARPLVNLDFSEPKHTWSGCRPLTSDGLPMIGRYGGWSNFSVAVGHGMYGLTLAPATGNAIAELLIDGKASVDLTPFAPNR
jgi:D-amino-acid dehydrogenase